MNFLSCAEKFTQSGNLVPSDDEAVTAICACESLWAKVSAGRATTKPLEAATVTGLKARTAVNVGRSAADAASDDAVGATAEMEPAADGAAAEGPAPAPGTALVAAPATEVTAVAAAAELDAAEGARSVTVEVGLTA